MNFLYGFIFILIGIPRETKNPKGCVVLDFFNGICFVKLN